MNGEHIPAKPSIVRRLYDILRTVSFVLLLMHAGTYLILLSCEGAYPATRLPSPDGKLEVIKQAYSFGAWDSARYEVFVVPAGQIATARHRVASVAYCDGLQMRWVNPRVLRIDLSGAVRLQDVKNRCRDCYEPGGTVYVEYHVDTLKGSPPLRWQSLGWWKNPPELGLQ